MQVTEVTLQHCLHCSQIVQVLLCRYYGLASRYNTEQIKEINTNKYQRFCFRCVDTCISLDILVKFAMFFPQKKKNNRKCYIYTFERFVRYIGQLDLAFGPHSIYVGLD